ncbi:MAG: hypothetical protein FWG53_00805 [Clostridiales bacterium]|nr:hypothetical protein [Clostridiales bacterium]
MKRYTTINPDGAISVPETDLPEALSRLAAFEDAFFELAQRQAEIPAELSSLRAAGKEKTVRYRELLAQKLMNSQIITLFYGHGIAEDK